MNKTLINPETGDWASHEVAYSDAVVVEHPSHRRVFISGMISSKPDLEAQTRDVLSQIESALDDVNGTINDIVRVRVYLAEPTMSEDSLSTIHDVRLEFFDPDHLPASTLVEVESLVTNDSLIEIDAEAIIPADEWETGIA